MAHGLLKIGKKYYSDYTEECDGSDCPTPEKKDRHWHRRRKKLGTDQAFAQIKLGERIKNREAVKKGEVIHNTSWPDFKQRYAEFVVLEKQSTRNNRHAALLHLETLYHIRELDDLTFERLELFQVYLVDKVGLARTTANRYVAAIKTMLTKAAKWKLYVDPGLEEIKKLKTPKGRIKFYTRKELALMLSKLNLYWRKVVMLGYYAGLRRMEMYSLPTQCVDFKLNRIHIEPNAEFTPKDYERRFIPMAAPLRAFLKANLNGSRYVLGDERMHPHNMTKHFPKKMRQLKLSGTLHTLRHSFGSHSAMAGIDLVKIKEWMGHASIETTEIYKHLSPEYLDQDIERLPKI